MLAHPAYRSEVILDSSFCLTYSIKISSTADFTLPFVTCIPTAVIYTLLVEWSLQIQIISFSCLKHFKYLFLFYRMWPKLWSRVQSFLPLQSQPLPLPGWDFCPSNSNLFGFFEMYHATIWFFTFANSFNSAWNSSSTSSPGLHLQTQILHLPRCLHSFNDYLLSTCYVPGTELRDKEWPVNET